LYIFCIVYSTLKTQAQSTVLFEHKTDSLPDKWGPNRKYYSSIAISIGACFASKHQGLHNNFSFPQLGVGYKFKQKLNTTFSMTYHGGFSYKDYNLVGDNLFPDQFYYGIHKTHANEHMGLINTNGEINVRVNFDPNRGDILGNYLEIGMYGSYLLYDETVIKDNGPGKMVIKTHYIHSPFFNPAQYGFNARLGHNGLALEFNYRLSNIFYAPYQAPELSRYIFGLHFGL
jgi:hypothetical protein